jgi:hypothetical protein
MNSASGSVCILLPNCGPDLFPVQIQALPPHKKLNFTLPLIFLKISLVSILEREFTFIR